MTGISFPLPGKLLEFEFVKPLNVIKSQIIKFDFELPCTDLYVYCLVAVCVVPVGPEAVLSTNTLPSSRKPRVPPPHRVLHL